MMFTVEKLVQDPLIIPQMMFFFILITFTLHIILILLEEIMSWSPMGVQGLRAGKTFRLNSP